MPQRCCRGSGRQPAFKSAARASVRRLLLTTAAEVNCRRVPPGRFGELSLAATDGFRDGRIPGFGVAGGLRERNRLRLRETMRAANVSPSSARCRCGPTRSRPRSWWRGGRPMRTVCGGVGRCGALTRPLAAYVDRPRRRWARWRRCAAGVAVLKRQVTKLNGYRLLGVAVYRI